MKNFITPRIESLSVNNYRTLQNVEIKDITPLTILLGPNGYSTWIPTTWRILVIVDRDDDDCKKLKQKLDDIAKQNFANHNNTTVVNRIAIEELEAWYFGDWAAVMSAYPKVPKTIPQKKNYRNPDDISGGTWEAFERILQKTGYFKGGLLKIEAAQTITPYMTPQRNNSGSFQKVYQALLKF